VSPLVVASASIRGSSPRSKSNSARSAPGCAIAMRMSVSIRFASTISPETACETLITVARSRCSSDVSTVEARTGILRRDIGIAQVKLGDLGQSAPAEVKLARLAWIALGYLLKAATSEEVGRELGGDSRILDEPLFQRRANCLLVEAHSLQVSANRTERCRSGRGISPTAEWVWPFPPFDGCRSISHHLTELDLEDPVEAQGCLIADEAIIRGL
jgi:hypothetical protein